MELKPPCPPRGHPQLFCWSCHCFHVLFPVQCTLNSFSAYCKGFIWHCWGILPSLQAALTLLADLLARTTKSGEWSPVKQRQLSSDVPNFCWLLMCSHIPVVPLSLPWKSRHCYIFWGTQEPINTFCPCTCMELWYGVLWATQELEILLWKLCTGLGNSECAGT